MTAVEFVTPTLGRVRLLTDGGWTETYRVTVLAGRLRLLTDARIVEAMTLVALRSKRLGEHEAFSEWLRDEAQMPIGDER